MKTPTRSLWRTGAAVLAGVLCSASPAMAAADAKTEAKADAKAAAKPAEPAKKPWEIEPPKSVFVDDRNKKELKDPFFPKTERRLTDEEIKKREEEKRRQAEEARRKQEEEMRRLAQGTGTTAAPGPDKPSVAPAKWFSTFRVSGMGGSLVGINTGSAGYWIPVGGTKQVVTPKGPMRVKVVKITGDSVEITAEGEKEPGTLPLP